MQRTTIKLLVWLGVLGSAVCNGWFSYGRGVMDWDGVLVDGLVFLAIFVSLDLIKPILPNMIRTTAQGGEYVKTLFASALLVCALAYSALAAYGFLQTNLANRTDGNAKVVQRYNAAQSRAVEQAAIVRAAKQSHRWRSTNGCTNATVPKSKNFCRDYRAAASQLARAEDLMVINKPKQHADPQSAGLAAVTGLDAAFIGASISIALALIVELFAAFGPFIFDNRPRPSLAPTEPSSPKVDRVGNVTELEGYILSRIDEGKGKARVSNKELASRFGISGPSATRAKARLAERGLIGIEKDGRNHVLVAV